MKNSGALLREHVPLCDKNTFAVGGISRYYCAPETAEELREALRLAHGKAMPLFVLGKGSNVLISDHGWPGLTLHLTDASADRPIAWEGAAATASGMAALNRLVKGSVERGYAGMEELAGIPGTVGGAVIMNAGAFTSCIADTLDAVTCCDRLGGEPLRRRVSELGLGYRTSLLQKGGDIVVSARFAFSRTADPRELERKRKEVIDRRRKKQPLDFPNCGSVFKRPTGNFAGALIEKCGLKGERCGGAEVSVKHANFIINTGGAKAGEVRRLICIIQKRVYEQCGVLLEPEVIFVGEFEEPLFRARP
ncbi:MAG: UDP-N-acetylmuramate dehydrogenase [Chitinispirillaceae bacterium]|nr:UDP-N-acetylmuramate dehydrogenase [Chitinispirillaceae bacterium]